MANRIYNTFFHTRAVSSRSFSSASSKSSSSSIVQNLKNILVKKIGFRSGSTRSTEFEESDIDFASITAAYDTDGYVRQGVDKYIDLMWKEGYDVFSKNTDASLYIKRRLAYVAEVTQIPQNQFLYDISEELIKYHNVIIAKARMTDPSQLPSGYNIQGLNDKEPVVGYFALNVDTFSALRDENGTVKKWKQTSEDGAMEKEFDPNDIIHIYYRREKGDLWAKPFLLPVLDDVRALRELEENVLRMAYRNIFPFNHIQVGTDEMPASEPEIDEVQAEIMDMDREGGLVTSHTVKITPIASNQIIDASPYLKHFEERVFSGIGIPGIMFGRGNTANRNTGDNMTNEVTDRVKAYQKVFEMFFYEKVIKEMLFEGGFDPIMNEDDKVNLQFKENDIDRMFKIQNQAIFLYEHHGVTEDEMREMIGKDPIETEEERNKMHQNIVTFERLRLENQLNIKFAQAEAEADNKYAAQYGGSGSDSSSGSGTSSSSGSDTKKNESSNKTQPENQSGKKTSSKKQTNALKDINAEYEALSDAVNDIIKSLYEDVMKSGNHDITKSLTDALSTGTRFMKELKEHFKYRETNIMYLLKEEECLTDYSFKRIYNVFEQIQSQIIKSLVVYNNMKDALDVARSTFDIYKDNLFDLCSTFLEVA